MKYVVRCRYIANYGEPEGVGYLTEESRCHRDLKRAARFDTEADAWAFANMSGEKVPDDCWVEPEPKNPCPECGQEEYGCGIDCPKHPDHKD